MDRLDQQKAREPSELRRESGSMLSIRDDLQDVCQQHKGGTDRDSILPIKVTVPGGVAFCTSAFERLNACLKPAICLEKGWAMAR